ncbi:FG-GAP-like repeat-containing protein [Tautonia sociabilis]|uniref:VCBS repeat-containing protein n=1 Tax=Tautonia sociabilis TaxID=2080755 RepID=A0A432MR79_9BACT|nr:FG-GAP-like repeat-containing protein [Tautonia sociabilis]RUL89759.1 hypothetical protein TsocGM_00925 [Tautonia sociabilis]
MLPKSRRPLPGVESLEPRLVLSSPQPYPGSPLELPQGAWRSTPFVGSPVLADLDGDGRDEILTPASGGRLVAYTTGSDGRLREFQRYETGAEANVKATPIVLDRPDGSKMIVAGLGRDEASSPNKLEDGRVFAWDAATGRLLPGWPQSSGDNGSAGVVGPLASGDLDGDGVPEIVVTSFSHHVSAFRQDGSLLWRFQNDDTIESGAVVGDIDRDGRNEVVFGSDTSDNPYFRAGGLINVLNANGSAKFRIPVGEVIWSSPVLADLTGDGCLEIVVGTGINFSLLDPSLSPDRREQARVAANAIHAYDHQGNIVPGWPYRTTTDSSQDRQVYSSPAVADLDGDGRLEVVAVDFAGHVHAVRGNGQPLPGFEGGIRLVDVPPRLNDTYTSPIIADADGDGDPDIIASSLQDMVALDRSGAELWRITAPVGPGGLADGLVNAAAVGQLDGVGGLELVASSNLFAQVNPPRSLGVYQLPESSLTPPWPMHRKTADAKAVAQSPNFVERSIRATFRAILGREASGSDLAFFSGLILSNTWTPKTLADIVALTPEARTVVLRKLYDSYLQREPTPQEIADGQQRLALGTAEQIARDLLLSPESIAKTDGSLAGILGRMYQTIFRRPIRPDEVAALVPVVEGGYLPIEEIARLLLLSEEFVLLEIAAPAVIAYRTEFPDAPFDDAAIAALLMDRIGGQPEERILAKLIASGGRYERTSLAAGLVRSALIDVNQNAPTPHEVGDWLKAFTRGAITPGAFFRAIIDAPEARAQYVREQVQQLLGREADSATIAALSGFSSREELRILIVSSPEYLARNGGTNEGFIRAAFRDLYGVDPLPQNVLSERLNALNRGRETRQSMARALVFSTPAYERDVVNLLFRYLPDESNGVLRVPIGAPAGSPPTNPDPALIATLVSARQAGASDAEILARILESSAYLSKTSWIRGRYRSPGLRW